MLRSVIEVPGALEDPFPFLGAHAGMSGYGVF
jgi:hypothetical protein